MIKRFLLIAFVFSVVGAYAQNDEWFDKNGNILPKYLDDNGLLSDEYLADAYEFTSLDEALANPLRVIKLNLSEQNLGEFPTEIVQCHNLHMLDLESNKLTSISPEVAMLSNLQYLVLNNNELTEIPLEIASLKNLLMLDLCANRLSTIPNEL